MHQIWILAGLLVLSYQNNHLIYAEIRERESLNIPASRAKAQKGAGPDVRHHRSHYSTKQTERGFQGYCRTRRQVMWPL